MKIEVNQITKAIIGASIELHKHLGPGLLESAYEMALSYELKELGFTVRRQVSMPFVYKGNELEVGYRIDLIVNETVLLEIKSVEQLAPVHFSQTLTYLKLSQFQLDLLINFNVNLLKDGVHRIVNNFTA